MNPPRTIEEAMANANGRPYGKPRTPIDPHTGTLLRHGNEPDDDLEPDVAELGRRIFER